MKQREITGSLFERDGKYTSGFNRLGRAKAGASLGQITCPAQL